MKSFLSIILKKKILCVIIALLVATVTVSTIVIITKTDNQEKNTQTEKKETKKKIKDKEEKEVSEITTENENKENNTEDNLTSKGENKTTISNSNDGTNNNYKSNNFSSNNNSTNSNNNQNSNKKVIVCTENPKGTGYYGYVKHTATFENNNLSYYILYIEKHFEEGYKAEDDSWTTTELNGIKNNTKAGITADGYIKNNTAYLTYKYDVKSYPNLTSMITKHTEYDDFLNNVPKDEPQLVCIAQ